MGSVYPVADAGSLVELATLGWVRRLIRAGSAGGPPPRFGSPDGMELPDAGRRKVAAVVIAALCWWDGSRPSQVTGRHLAGGDVLRWLRSPNAALGGQRLLDSPAAPGFTLLPSGSARNAPRPGSCDPPAGGAVVITFTRRAERALELLAQTFVDAAELTPHGIANLLGRVDTTPVAALADGLIAAVETK